ITDTTGMSISGKMSVGVVTIAKTPRSTIASPMTTKVYGRRSASRTIHIEPGLPPSPGDAGEVGRDSKDGERPRDDAGSGGVPDHRGKPRRRHAFRSRLESGHGITRELGAPTARAHAPRTAARDLPGVARDHRESGVGRAHVARRGAALRSARRPSSRRRSP